MNRYFDILYPLDALRAHHCRKEEPTLMVLAVDVGNSNIVLGGYRDGKVAFLSRVATNQLLEADQYAVLYKDILALYGAEGDQIEGVILSSVVPGLTPKLLRAFAHITNVKPRLLTLADKGSLRIVDDSTELGMDLLASAIAAYHSCPLPVVVVDMGTATKLTAIDDDHILRGVAIAPGLYVSLDALLSHASLLSGVPLDEAPTEAIGRNSSDSIRSGVIFGAASMLDGMIDRFEQELGGPATVVATGGAAHLVVPHCRHDIELRDTLLLDGLYHAYTHQA